MTGEMGLSLATFAEELPIMLVTEPPRDVFSLASCDRTTNHRYLPSFRRVDMIIGIFGLTQAV